MFKLNPVEKIVTEQTTIYRFNSMYSWFLIFCLILLLVSFYLKNEMFSAVVYAIFFIYFLLKVVLGSSISREISKAVKEGNAEISGNRYSFSNPLEVKVNQGANESNDIEDLEA